LSYTPAGSGSRAVPAAERREIGNPGSFPRPVSRPDLRILKVEQRIGSVLASTIEGSIGSSNDPIRSP
jgi:hypothetical protein